MQNPYKSKEFLSLKAVWDRKLSESGFEDIERADKRTGEMLLIKWDSHYFQVNNHPDAFDIQHEYFLKAGQFLNTHKFKSKTDLHIWKLHAEGLSVRQTAEYLNNRGIRTNKDYVARILNEYKAIMKEAPIECKKKTSSQLELWSQLIMELSTPPG